MAALFVCFSQWKGGERRTKRGKRAKRGRWNESHDKRFDRDGGSTPASNLHSGKSDVTQHAVNKNITPLKVELEG